MPPAKKAGNTTKKARGPRTMSAEHKAALAVGRESSRAVGRYLDAVTTPKARGRKVTPASLHKRLAEAEAKSKTATGAARLEAIQAARDLRARLTAVDGASATDLAAVEKDFVKHAKAYGERKGITYGSWREAGVPAAVLKRAGIKRTR
jgi:hypothetical protein